MISKLGYRDSNPEMQESKSCALPFGDTPLNRRRFYTADFSCSKFKYFKFAPAPITHRISGFYSYSIHSIFINAGSS